jgi:alginate O-acetyltransferase complex protein AlgI
VEIESGLAQFGLGVVKKVVIADQVARHVDLIFAAPGHFDALTLLQGAVGYAIQIYCDFAGYSDMAIGAARVMGYRTPENFQMPYAATDITDFWRRWHISLSSWLRDYVFLPLAYGLSRRMPDERYAGIRVDVAIYIIAIMVTFLACGLWHGASWTFVLWGLLHGTALAVHRAWKLWSPPRRRAPRRWSRFGWQVSSRVATLGIVLVGWILFRADSLHAAWLYLVRIATWESGGTRLPSPYIIPACLAVAAVHALTRRDANWAEEVPSRPMAVRVLSYASLVFLIASLGATDAVPFIYAQF